MPFRLRIIIAAVAILGFIYIANQVRTKKIELKYTLTWFLVIVLLLIADLFPDLLGWLSTLLGIAVPINMLFLFGFILVILIIFGQTVITSNLTRRVKRLTQEVALSNERIEELEKKMQDIEGKTDEKES